MARGSTDSSGAGHGNTSFCLFWLSYQSFHILTDLTGSSYYATACKALRTLEIPHTNAGNGSHDSTATFPWQVIWFPSPQTQAFPSTCILTVQWVLVTPIFIVPPGRRALFSREWQTFISQWPYPMLVWFFSLSKRSLLWPTLLTWYSCSQVPNTVARCSALFFLSGFCSESCFPEDSFMCNVRDCKDAHILQMFSSPRSSKILCFPASKHFTVQGIYSPDFIHLHNSSEKVVINISIFSIKKKNQSWEMEWAVKEIPWLPAWTELNGGFPFKWTEQRQEHKCRKTHSTVWLPTTKSSSWALLCGRDGSQEATLLC